MLIRLLQNFSSVSLDEQSQPLETRTPSSWKKDGGRKATEKIWPKMHLTLYTHVRYLFPFLEKTDLNMCLGWTVGQDG